MRLFFAAILLALSLCSTVIGSAALAPAHAVEVQFPRGAAIGLVPPPGMVESTQFSGFEDPAHKASILVVDMPAEAYDQIAAGFSDAALGAKGITLEKRESFPLKGARAMLFVGNQNAGPVTVRKWVLLVGNDASAGLITLQVPVAEASAYPDAAVRAAFSTVAFRGVADQMGALPFVLTNLAGFRPIKALGGTTLLLTDGPKDVVEGPEQAVFVVSIAGGAPRDDERRQFALRALASVPGVKDLRLERAEPQRIGGQAGFEVMATGVDVKTGTPVKLVQWLRFGPNAYIRMVGVTRLDAFPDTYDRLRALRDGLEAR
ncbi:hypothetical protein ABLE93_15315 [Xanthobacter sp. KR7-65]|uniref:hypothetical protein n=1 Tax=Xanthobacter sp. KR7-65 TaxID=3156612 RepID=UPI0032B38229